MKEVNDLDDALESITGPKIELKGSGAQKQRPMPQTTKMKTSFIDTGSAEKIAPPQKPAQQSSAHKASQKLKELN